MDELWSTWPRISSQEISILRLSGVGQGRGEHISTVLKVMMTCIKVSLVGWWHHRVVNNYHINYIFLPTLLV